MKKFAQAMTLVGLTGLSITAFAGHDAQYHYAKVTHVEPIVQTVSRQTPHKECWIETVRYESEEPVYHERPKSHTGTVVGTLVGAAIGHSVGNGRSNKQLGAVAGAVLGAAVGSDISRQHHRYHHSSSRTRVQYKDEERCSISHRTEYEEKVVGYDVSYRYGGKMYQTTMDHHPGKRIKVAVDVRPVKY